MHVRRPEDRSAQSRKGSKGGLLLLGGAHCSPICRCFGQVWYFNLSDSNETETSGLHFGEFSEGSWLVEQGEEGEKGEERDARKPGGERERPPTRQAAVPCARYKHLAVVLSRSLFCGRGSRGGGEEGGDARTTCSSGVEDAVVLFGGESYRKGFDYHKDLWLLS